MERLTEKHYRAEDYYLLCSADCGVDMDCVDCPAFERAIDRLGAYEDTGLTPELIEELLADATAMHKELKQIKETGALRHGRWMLEAHAERVNCRWNVTAECSECCNGQKEIWAGFFPGVPDYLAEPIALDSAKTVALDNYCPNCGAKMGGDTRKPYEPPRAEIIMEGGRHEQIAGAALGAGAEPAGCEREAEGDRPAYGRGNGEPV